MIRSQLILYSNYSSLRLIHISFDAMPHWCRLWYTYTYQNWYNTLLRLVKVSTRISIDTVLYYHSATSGVVTAYFSPPVFSWGLCWLMYIYTCSYLWVIVLVGHCIVCLSSIYGVWFSPFHLQQMFRSYLISYSTLLTSLRVYTNFNWCSTIE
jgi:hypothetical protein